MPHDDRHGCDMLRLEIRALSPARLGDYLRFFETRAFTDNPRWARCYCFFPYHDPKTMDWEQRSASENREAICGCIGAGTAQGYLAYRDGEVIGWCNAAPRALYPMLGAEPAPDADATGAIFCFVVAPEQRGQGVATTLLQAACDGLRGQGLRWVQARPLRHASGPAANHLGPLAMYLAAGFAIMGEDSQGNVFMRRSLA